MKHLLRTFEGGITLTTYEEDLLVCALSIRPVMNIIHS